MMHEIEPVEMEVLEDSEYDYKQSHNSCHE